MKRESPKTRPGLLAAMVAFAADPERESKVGLQHQPGCATERGAPCNCYASLERKEWKK